MNQFNKLKNQWLFFILLLVGITMGDKVKAQEIVAYENITQITAPSSATDDALLLASSILVNKQGNSRDKLNMMRINYVLEQLQLPSDVESKFQTVYRKYLKDLGKLNLNGKDPAIVLKNKEDKLDLEKGFFKEAQNILSSEQMSKLLEAEDKFKKMAIQEYKKRQGQK